MQFHCVLLSMVIVSGTVYVCACDYNCILLCVCVCADDKLINLDPHYCQMAVNTNTSEFDIRTYHCRTPRKLTASKMDPSCTIGFFCETREDFTIMRRKTEPVSQMIISGHS